ncbi:hypothetical protein MTBBW1_730002 [Desulfamplus magnetovallimortis]|uniref:Uncharacterized protein n=1 Tax=Desulfamplus magnetovallimortis TaxID=1246637 RepID=A0A1W1HIZ4_9BACT|nr:hypothetical protein MTBBW1_730002 [Desulfamplus magnetovallimortis]
MHRCDAIEIIGLDCSGRIHFYPIGGGYGIRPLRFNFRCDKVAFYEHYINLLKNDTYELLKLVNTV